MAASASVGAAERRIILYTASTHSLIHILEWTYSALLVDIGYQYGAGFFLLGALSNVFSYAFGFAALPSGLLTDRLGSQRVLYLCLGGASLAAVLVGLSPNVWVLAIALAALGLAIGLYHPAGVSLIAQGVRQRGMALGLHGVAGNLGIAATPLLAVTVADASSWRAAYFLLAGLSLVLGLVLRAVRMGDEERPTAPAPVAAAPASEPTGTRTLLLWPLILVYAVFVLNGFVYSAARTFLPTHIRLKGYEDLGAAMTTVALLTGALGQYVGGSLTQRYALERLAPIMPILVVPALVLMGTAHEALLVVAAAAFVMFSFGGQPVFNSLIADYTPTRLLGRSYGVSFFASFGLASFGSTYAGFFADRWDTAAVFLALIPVAIMTAVVGLALSALAQRQPITRAEAGTREPPAPF
jgi:MFS family permease